MLPMWDTFPAVGPVVAYLNPCPLPYMLGANYIFSEVVSSRNGQDSANHSVCPRHLQQAVPHNVG